MKHLRPAISMTLVFIVLTGLIFPGAIWAISQAAFPHQANGSFIKDSSGKIIGSELIGQMFTSPRYFHPRPSAAGSAYDAKNSGGTNLGPTSKKLLEGIEGFDGIAQLAEQYRKENGLEPNTPTPVDAVTRSASGLDPHISVANAVLQADRVAKQWGMNKESLNRLIKANTMTPLLGVFGEPRVNVLALNKALDK